MISVAANLSWLVPGAVGGSEEYAVRLLKAVVDAAPADIDLRIIGSAHLAEVHPQLAVVPFESIPGPMATRAYRVIAESTLVHRATRSADVVHHFGGHVPARRHGNDIVTLHDLQPLHLPENFTALKRRYLAWALPRSASAARLVLTPSEWVAGTVIERFGCASSAVRAVPSTWDDNDEVDTAAADALGDGPVVLYPAVTHPHKNHVVLIEAIDALVADIPGVTLVLTGGAGRSEATVAARLARARATIVRPGRVSAAALRGLYRRADVLAFPSSYEGFGLPVLEAMRAGVPVVAADATALPEVLAGTGELVAALDHESWVAAIARVLTGGAEIEERTAAARARAEHYAPTVSAARLVDAWRAAA